MSGQVPGTSLVGTTLGNYRVVSLLGQGGMGSVYLAEHVLIGRKVAIKVLDPQIADQPEVVSRFFVEARAVNEIRHPNIVEVTDLGTHQGRPFIVMEHLPGETLEARIARHGRLAPEDTVRIARQVASALGAAHDRGMVHRDLKPANIMLRDHEDYPDFVKVLDFGIAKLLGTSTQVEASHRTEVGTLLGTPAFMSPEQCLGDSELDHRSDIYSLGIIVYLMLAGRLPFEAPSVGRLILCHVHEPPPRLADIAPWVPQPLAAVVERALAKKAEARFSSMKELRVALEQALGNVALPRSLTPVSGQPVVRAGPPATPTRPAGPAAGAAARPPVARADAFGSTLPSGFSLPGALPAPDHRRLEEATGERIARGQLALPALPAVHAQCLELLRDPGVSFSALAARMKQDARLTSHVIRRANTDVAGGGVAVSAEQASARLGVSRLRASILELAARRVIETRNERLEDEIRRPWQHAVATGILAERLARMGGAGWDERAADAQLAGLLRDIGVPLVATLIFELEQELAGRGRARSAPPEVWLGLVRVHQRRAAELLVRHWELPEELARAVKDAGAVQPSAGWTLGNVAALAGALADREGFHLRREHLAEAEGVIDGGARALGLGELKLRRLVDRIKEAVRSRE